MTDHNESTTKPSPRDEEVAAILAAGEAGAGAAMRIIEAAEGQYFGAIAATTVQPLTVTTNSAW
jgi:hypothetical protein